MGAFNKIYCHFNREHVNSKANIISLILGTFNECVYYLKPMDVKKQISIDQTCQSLLLLGISWEKVEIYIRS